MATMLYTQPYVQHKVWKLPVKLLLLAISILSALLNIVAYASKVDSPGVTGLAYVLLTACIGLVVVFVVSFWRMILKGSISDAAVLRKGGKVDEENPDGPAATVASLEDGGADAGVRANPLSLVSPGTQAQAVPAPGPGTLVHVPASFASGDGTMMFANPMRVRSLGKKEAVEVERALASATRVQTSRRRSVLAAFGFSSDKSSDKSTLPVPQATPTARPTPTSPASTSGTARLDEYRPRSGVPPPPSPRPAPPTLPGNPAPPSRHVWRPQTSRSQGLKWQN